MVMAAAVPWLDAEGRLQAVLCGGNLVNRRYEIVDAIKREVFPHEAYRGRDIGTVTIFQGDSADFDQRHDGRWFAGGGHAL